MCYFPWPIHENICKHAIKVEWLYFFSMDSNTILDQGATPSSFNAPTQIDIEAPNLDSNVDITTTTTDSVDLDY